MVRHDFISAAFAVCLSVAVLVPTSAKAGFMPEFTGYTQMGSAGGSATDVVNFAVYQNSGADGGDWATQLGVTPTAGADLTAQYVYMYEVVNNGGANSKIGYFNVNSYSQPYTSSGWLAGTVFSNGSAVGPAGNQYLVAGATMPPADPVVSSPSVSGVSAPAFIASASAVNPLGSNPGGAGNSNVASFLFFTGAFSQSLTNGLYSSVLFLTSDTAPTYSAGQVLNSTAVASSDGGIPTQAPEPASLALWGLGVLGCGLAVKRGRRKSAAAAA